MNESILQVQDISLKLNSAQILQEISLELSRGQTLAVVGHNGAGKTSLFHTILGLKYPTSGEIELFQLSPLRPASRQKVGYVPERPYLSLDQTLNEALFYWGKLQGVPFSDLLLRMEAGAKRLNLHEVLKRKLSTFSKGMLQKTLLLQAELHDPELLILDEPMSGLDPEAREDLKSHLKSWKQGGKSLLFSSHVAEDVRELADGVLELEKGKTLFYGPIAEWRKS